MSLVMLNFNPWWKLSKLRTSSKTLLKFICGENFALLLKAKSVQEIYTAYFILLLSPSVCWARALFQNLKSPGPGLLAYEGVRVECQIMSASAYGLNQNLTLESHLLSWLFKSSTNLLPHAIFKRYNIIPNRFLHLTAKGQLQNFLFVLFTGCRLYRK